MLVKNANHFIYSFPKVCSLKKKRIVKIMVTYLFNAKSANVERVQIANFEKTILPDKLEKFQLRPRLHVGTLLATNTV